MFGGPVFAQLNTCDLREHALEARASSRRTDDFTTRGTIGRLTDLALTGATRTLNSIELETQQQAGRVRCSA